MSALRQEREDVLIFVWAKPRASKSRLISVAEDELHVALAAPPVEGAANSELLKFLAGVLGVAKGRLSLERGESSRHKVVRAAGLSLEVVLSKLQP